MVFCFHHVGWLLLACLLCRIFAVAFLNDMISFFWALFYRLEPYADPYYDYEIERFWRGGQYENFRVQYTEAEPYHNYRVSMTHMLKLSSSLDGV